MTDSGSYLHNNAFIRKATNPSVSGGSTPTAENRCQCLTWALSKRQKQTKKTPTKKQTHPHPPAPLSCHSCSCMRLLLQRWRESLSVRCSAPRPSLGRGRTPWEGLEGFGFTSCGPPSEASFLCPETIEKSRMDTRNKNEPQNAPNMYKKAVIHRQEKQGLAC